MNPGQLIDRLVKKHWTQADIDKYVGDYQFAALTHASDEKIRESSASGGTTSALLINGLAQGLFDAAVVCKTVIEDGKVRARFVLASNKEEVLAARGSKYVETSFLREVLPLLEAFSGRVAVVGLPCDITALNRRAFKDPILADKLQLTIALVCGHNSRKELIDHTTAKLEKQENSELVDYKFRIGHWRGKIEATFANGQIKQYPTALFNDYQNLFFCCEKKCMACYDHYGYHADISIGDVWLYRLKSDPVKRSGVIVRTDQGKLVYDESLKSGVLVAEQLAIEDIMDGQSRIAPAHYNVSARVAVAPQFGYKLIDSVNEQIKWHQKLNAYLTLKNIKTSETEAGREKIFKRPRKLLKFYLYIKKGLETLR